LLAEKLGVATGGALSSPPHAAAKTARPIVNIAAAAGRTP
jgi:hypothetical protein